MCSTGGTYARLMVAVPDMEAVRVRDHIRYIAATVVVTYITDSSQLTTVV